MYKSIRSLLFRLEPETAHQLTLQVLRLAGNIPLSNWLLTQVFKAPSKPVHAFGLTFKNPIGLAAGYDKNAVAIKGLSALGFGHVEVGTVTPKPQPGNPRPRVFRLVEDEAVINRLGFPGKGAASVVHSLQRGQKNFVLTGGMLRMALEATAAKKESAPSKPFGDMILGV